MAALCAGATLNGQWLIRHGLPHIVNPLGG